MYMSILHIFQIIYIVLLFQIQRDKFYPIDFRIL